MRKITHMKHRNLTFILIAAAAIPMSLAAQAETEKTAVKTMVDNTHQLSDKRRAQIDQILEEAITGGMDLTDKAKVAALEARVGTIVPLAPAWDAQTLTLPELNALAEKKNADKFTAELDADVKAAADKRAAEKYPLVKSRTKVSIKCETGPLAGQTISGVFYQATPRYAEIGSKRVTFVDMTPEQRSMFDVRFNKALRDKYAAELLKNYDAKKAKSQEQIFRKLMKNQQLENEQNGYIFDSRSEKWVTARTYFREALKPAQERQRVLMAERAAQAAEEAKVQAAINGGTSFAYGAATQDTGDEERYKEVMDSVKKAWAEINKTQTGIDANQGYGNAHWGVTRSEAAYIFSRNPNYAYVINMSNDMLAIKNGNPKLVKFSYKDSKLNKTEEIYGDITYETFEDLKIRLHERLGLATEEKAQEDKDLFGMIEKSELQPKKEDNGYFIFTWQGKQSRGTLSFIYDSEADAYKDVVFTKELTAAQ